MHFRGKISSTRADCKKLKRNPRNNKAIDTWNQLIKALEQSERNILSKNAKPAELRMIKEGMKNAGQLCIDVKVSEKVCDKDFYNIYGQFSRRLNYSADLFLNALLRNKLNERIPPEHRENVKFNFSMVGGSCSFRFEIENSFTLYRHFKDLSHLNYTFNHPQHTLIYQVTDRYKGKEFDKLLSRLSLIFEDQEKYKITVGSGIEVLNQYLSTQKIDDDNEKYRFDNIIKFDKSESFDEVLKEKKKTKGIAQPPHIETNNNHEMSFKQIILDTIREKYGPDVTIGRIKNSPGKAKQYVVFPGEESLKQLDITKEQHAKLKSIFRNPKIVGFSRNQGFKYYHEKDKPLVAKVLGAFGYIRVAPSEINLHPKGQDHPAYAVSYYNRRVYK